MMGNQKNRLSVTASFDRSLAWYRGRSYRYLDLQLTTPQLGPEEGSAVRESKPLNLALVIDASGSMSGLPLQAAIDAARGVVGQLGSRDRLSLVAFDSEVKVLLQGVECNDAGRQCALDALSRVTAGTATNLSGGWLQGAELLARTAEGNPGVRSRIVLLTDGHANHGLLDPEILAEHAAALHHLGISTSCVGIGDHYSTDQIQAIADAGGGRMHDAERSEEIVEVVLAELGELGQEVVEQLRLEITFPPGLRFTPLHSHPTKFSSGQLVTSHGALPAGTTRHLLYRVVIPAGEVDDTLSFDITVHWRECGGKKMRRRTLKPLLITLAKGKENNRQRRDPEVGRRAAEAWQANLISEALRLNRDNQYHKATELLSRQLRHFERYCDGLPGGDELVSGLRSATARISQPIAERSRKEIHLALYKRTRSEQDLRMSAPRPEWSSYFSKR
jgi:Ca-activated chloride channel family protein